MATLIMVIHCMFGGVSLFVQGRVWNCTSDATESTFSTFKTTSPSSRITGVSLCYVCFWLHLFAYLTTQHVFDWNISAFFLLLNFSLNFVAGFSLRWTKQRFPLLPARLKASYCSFKVLKYGRHLFDIWTHLLTLWTSFSICVDISHIVSPASSPLWSLK